MPGLDGTSLFAPGLFVTLFEDDVIVLTLDGQYRESDDYAVPVHPESARLLADRRAVGLVEEALRGRRFVARL